MGELALWVADLFWPEVALLAVPHHRSVYDCSCVALAILLNAQLLTGDEKLADALSRKLPVKWLRAI